MPLFYAAAFRLLIPVLFLLILPRLDADDGVRQRIRMDDEWKFFLGNDSSAQDADFSDEGWRTVTLPHDWSIEGKFDAKAPMGGPGGFLSAGIGWYRKHFTVPSGLSDQRISVEFEGVYMNADVWLNGQNLATHPYGYTSFNVDLTPAIKSGDNILAVRVDNSKQKNSRWYSGSGIYRHVWLTVTGPVHVAPWGIFVSVPHATADTASISVDMQVVNESQLPSNLKVVTVLLSPTGAKVGQMVSNCSVPAGGGQTITQRADVTQPDLWTPETPQISQAVTSLYDGAKVIDKVTTPYGIRSLAWNAQKGLLLNDVSIKLNGGCIHGDNGVLGAAAFDRAEERKIELLKASGFNEVRTAHAPASPALLDACDRLGMLVMEDAFDCWVDGKNDQDYHIYFKEWWQRDLESMILRDRNHPSIIFWNIGNEIPNVLSDIGADYNSKLIDSIHAQDKTRPVTNAIVFWPNDSQMKFARTEWSLEDIVGSNYALGNHIREHDQYPDRTLVGTENYPGDPGDRRADVIKNDFVVGDNVWTAQDYLGESGIGRWFYIGDPEEPVDPPRNANDKEIHTLGHGNDRLFPWHGSLCGDLDILGNRKPMAHWRNIVWKKGEKLYMAVRQPEDETKKVYVVQWGFFPAWESWTWPGWEGKSMAVEIYSAYDKVRLYLNGEKVGESDIDHQGRRAIMNLNYQPGTLKVVGLQDGSEVDNYELSTVRNAASIRLTPDRTTIHADGQDLSFVNVEVTDKDGKLQPNADQEITFTLTGPATIAGLGNANMKSVEPYQGTQCRVFHGQAQIVIRSTNKPGTVELKAHADGIDDGGASLQTQLAK